MAAAKARKPRAPVGIGRAGRRLWDQLTADYEFLPHEAALLEFACRQADDVAALEAAVAADGMVVAGAAGQRRLNGAVTELRNSRLAVGKLLGLLAMPDEDERPMSGTSVRAQKAATVRWNRRREFAERQARAAERAADGEA